MPRLGGSRRAAPVVEARSTPAGPKGAEAAAGTRVRLSGRWIQHAGASGRAGGLLLVGDADSLRADPSPADQLSNWLARTTRRALRHPHRDRGGVGAQPSRRHVPRTSRPLRPGRSGAHPLDLRIPRRPDRRLGGAAWRGCWACRATGCPARAPGSPSAYVVFLGWPPPAARAALLAGLAALFHLATAEPSGHLPSSRSPASWWCWSIPGPCWMPAPGSRPRALSGALIVSRWSDRALGTRLGMAHPQSASVGATLATAPITAALSGWSRLPGSCSTFVAIPLAAVAVPGVLLSLLLAAIVPGCSGARSPAGSGALLGRARSGRLVGRRAGTARR